jgi:hypothetical protein
MSFKEWRELQLQKKSATRNKTNIENEKSKITTRTLNGLKKELLKYSK